MNELNRLIYVGVFNDKTFDHYRYSGFLNAGIDTTCYDFRDGFKHGGDLELFSAISQLIYRTNAQAVFVNKGEVISGNVVNEIRNFFPHVKFFLFYGDQREEIPLYIKNNVKAYDAFLINNKDTRIKSELCNEHGAKSVVYHHTATDTDVFKRYSREKEVYDVVFFGSDYGNSFPLSAKRSQFINNIATDFSL